MRLMRARQARIDFGWMDIKENGTEGTKDHKSRSVGDLNRTTIIFDVFSSSHDIYNNKIYIIPFI